MDTGKKKTALIDSPGKLTHMKQNEFQQWREKLGLSQQALADYIGVSRGLVNLVERGERQLPLPALVLVTQLITTYEKVAAALQMAPPGLTSWQNSLRMLQKSIKETTWQLTRMQEKLTTMETDHTQALCQGQVYQRIRQEMAVADPTATQEKQLHWLAIKQEEAHQQLKSTNSQAQLPLRIKIAELQAGLQEAQTLLAILTSTSEDQSQEAGQSGTQTETQDKVLPVKGK